MSLNAFYTKEEDVPEALKEFYPKKGERWELEVEIPGIDGVKSFTDFEKLNGALRKERSDHKVVKDKVKLLGDRSIEDLLAQVDRIEELEASLEAAGGTGHKKVEELVEARLKKEKAPLERERDQLKGQLDAATNTIKTFEGEKKTRSIHDAVREAAAKAKLLPEAIDDALSLSERVMEVGEDGVVTVRDGSGYGVGLNAVGWMSELQQKKAHWWGPSGGGGAGGNRGGNGAIKNPWTEQHWNMTEQGALVRDNPTQASALAAAAGTKIGGMRPNKK